MGIPLSKLKSGHAARVLAITDACDGLGRRRLLDLGVTPGVSVFVERANTGASDVAYRVRHTRHCPPPGAGRGHSGPADQRLTSYLSLRIPREDVMATSQAEARDCRTTCRGPHRRLGLHTRGYDHVVALAGNPNTGKSTVFNALTGLRQHTGNWPGKNHHAGRGRLRT